MGTHRDQVSQEEFERKDKLLLEKVKETEFFRKGLVEFASDDHLMFAVDNENGEDDIEAMQRRLEEVIRKHFKKVEIPVSWLVLSLCLRRQQLSTLRLEECERLAGKVGINPSELQHALSFLHDHGLLLYYPEVQAMKHIIISDIQVSLS